MKKYIKDSIDDIYIVDVGGVEQYEISAKSENDAVQIFLSKYASPEDIEEYEEDPSYIWAMKLE